MKGIEIGVFQAKTHLSEIIRRVVAGERFFITHRGKRVAELGPPTGERRRLERGCAKNPDYRMAEDFDDALADLKDYM